MPKKIPITPAAAGCAPDAMLNPQEAANFLGCNTSTLARWRKQQPTPIPFSAPGPRIIRYRFSDLCAAAQPQAAAI